MQKLIFKIGLLICTFLLIPLNFYAQVTTTISNFKVNNITTTGITFNTLSVNVTFEVDLKTTNGDSNNTFGNLYIYTKKSSSDIENQVYANAIVFTPTYPPFVPQTTYNSKSYVTISLPQANFYATGGVLYAEYKNNNNQKYKSSDIVISGGTMPAPGGTIAESLTVSDIVNSETAVSMSDKFYLSGNDETENVNIEYVRKLSQGQSCSGQYILIVYKHDGSSYQRVIQTVPGDSCYGTGLPVDGIVRGVSLTTADFIGGGGYIQLRLYNTSTYKMWTSAKVPVETIEFTSRNNIFSTNGNNEVVEGSNVNISGVQSNVITGYTFDPRTGTVRPVTVPATSYEWLKRSPGGSWIVISGANSSSYYGVVNGTTEFMRRSYYNSAHYNSNILTITTRVPDTTNTICCTQRVHPTTAFQTIVGNLSDIQNVGYQWQEQSRTSPWTNIVGANSKDYTPPTRYNESTVLYRRIVTNLNSQVTSISNEIATTVCGRCPLSAEAEMINAIGLNDISIYPNPSTSMINVDSELGLSNAKIYLSDATGRNLQVKNANEFSTEVNISTLPKGTYYLIIESDSGKVTKQFVKQ